MIYIVTGLMRTGTSLMMQVLQAAGIPPYYSKAYERRSMDGRLRNPMFLESAESIKGDISAVPDGGCVKVFLNFMHCIELDVGLHRVIAMARSTKDRLLSTRSGMSRIDWRRYQKKCTHANTRVEAEYAALDEQFPSRLVVDFNQLIDTPKVILRGISNYIQLPQTEAMQIVIQPRLRHYRSPE